MFKNIRYKIAALFAAVTMLAAPIAMVPAIASASAIGDCIAAGTDVTNVDINSATNATCSNTAIANSANGGALSGLIKTVINVFSLIVGVVSVIMIIVGGLRYITSGGDSGKVSAAKNTIIYAIIGLVVVALAQFIVQFVLSKASSLN
jgi:hypothetical protein